jgi:hypothetical protein
MGSFNLVTGLFGFTFDIPVDPKSVKHHVTEEFESSPQNDADLQGSKGQS